MSAAEIAQELIARKYGRSWWALCPVHDDHSPSLKIDQARDGTVLVKCWAGAARRTSSPPSEAAGFGMLTGTGNASQLLAPSLASQ